MGLFNYLAGKVRAAKAGAPSPTASAGRAALAVRDINKSVVDRSSLVVPFESTYPMPPHDEGNGLDLPNRAGGRAHDATHREVAGSVAVPAGQAVVETNLDANPSTADDAPHPDQSESWSRRDFDKLQRSLESASAERREERATLARKDAASRVAAPAAQTADGATVPTHEPEPPSPAGQRRWSEQERARVQLALDKVHADRGRAAVAEVGGEPGPQPTGKSAPVSPGRPRSWSGDDLTRWERSLAAASLERREGAATTALASTPGRDAVPAAPPEQSSMRRASGPGVQDAPGPRPWSVAERASMQAALDKVHADRERSAAAAQDLSATRQSVDSAPPAAAEAHARQDTRPLTSYVPPRRLTQEEHARLQVALDDLRAKRTASQAAGSGTAEPQALPAHRPPSPPVDRNEELAPAAAVAAMPVISRAEPGDCTRPTLVPVPVSAQRPAGRAASKEIADDELFQVFMPGAATPQEGVPPQAQATEFRIPPRRIPPPERWLKAEDEVEVEGIAISGLVYVGTPDPSEEDLEPSLIDPELPIELSTTSNSWPQRADPRYADLSPAQRGAYLEWLSTDRRGLAPGAFLKLYFLGLERRVCECHGVEGAGESLDEVTAEIEGLVSSFGETSGWIREDVTRLADLLELERLSSRLYLQPTPAREGLSMHPLHVRVAIGQAAFDQAPLPARWARAWLNQQPGDTRSKDASLCPEEFQRLFNVRYLERFGEGLSLPRQGEPLTLVYTPVGMGLKGRRPLTFRFQDAVSLPSSLSALDELQDVQAGCLQELAEYCEFVRRSSSDGNEAERFVRLPPAIWPEDAKEALHTITCKLKEGMHRTTLAAVLKRLCGETMISLEGRQLLLRQMRTLGIGFEPEEFAATLKPVSAAPLILFDDTAMPGATGDPHGADIARSTLDLAIGIAGADGGPRPEDCARIAQHISGWSHLEPRQVRRLLARLDAGVAEFVDVKATTELLLGLDLATRRGIARDLAKMALLDDSASSARRAALRITCDALGTEVEAQAQALPAPELRIEPPPTPSPQRPLLTLNKDRVAAIQADSERVAILLGNVFAGKEVHPPTEPLRPRATPAVQAPAPGLMLDLARIALIQADSQRAAVLLGSVFVDEEAAPLPELPQSEPAAPPTDGPQALGLDSVHHRLVLRLLTRTCWSRDDLQLVAHELDLMLDGALEHVNEAFYDAFDAPLVDGDDPVEVHPDAASLLEVGPR